MLAKKPKIGIVGLRERSKPGNIFKGIEKDLTNDLYIQAVLKGGGIPLTIPVVNIANKDIIEQQVLSVDAVILQGGDDICPTIYGQEKHESTEEPFLNADEHNIFVYKTALKYNKPVLGICRGCQLINVINNGTLCQDLTLRKLPENIKADNHRIVDVWDVPKAHNIMIDENSVLYSLLKKKEVAVNSIHHQTIDKVGEGIKVTARSPDGCVEAIEIMNDKCWVLAVQFHPEALLPKSDDFLPIFIGFIEAAKSRLE